MSAKHHEGKYWHEERGERYGNERRSKAEEKRKEQRRRRAQEKREWQ